MRWEKKGLIYCPDGTSEWATTAAMIPTPHRLSDDVIRLYISCCDPEGIGRVGYVDVEARNPKKVINVSPEPIVDIGVPGAFDDNGAVVCGLAETGDGGLFMYYVGFELCHKIRYRLFTGLAISRDGGNSFNKYSRAPVLDRTSSELFFRCGPFCMREKGVFRLWYVSGDAWTDIDGKSMPVYTIRYQESLDGITWSDKGRVCIDIEHEDEHGFGRPYVIRHDGIYKMFYSIRVRHKGYRLGYAESSDGVVWVRKDNALDLDVSPAGWDAEMVCYPSIVSVDDRYYLFYNGNGFGKSGFGYAELQSW